METVVIVLLAGAVGLEALAACALWLLHRHTGVFYAPRDAPRLSPACRSFLTRLVRAGGEGGVLRFDSALGWAPAPNRPSATGAPETNSMGIRSRIEPTTLSSDGVARVAAFGDCLTYGEGVALEDSWPARLEQLVPGTEVLNFGVDGYGLDQCYLRYRWSLGVYGSQRVVIIAFVSSNIYKALNAFRPFYAYDHDLKLAKPRFELRHGRLELVPNPVPAVSGYERLLGDPDHELRRLGALDAYHRDQYRRRAWDRMCSLRLVRIVTHEFRKLRRVRDRYGRFVPGSEALRTTVATLDEFCARVRAEAATPVVLLLPTPEDVRGYRRHGLRPWGPLIGHLEASRVCHIDGLAALCDGEPAPAPDWFEGRHLSPAASDRLARHLAPVVGPLCSGRAPLTAARAAAAPVTSEAPRVPGDRIRAAPAASHTPGSPRA